MLEAAKKKGESKQPRNHKGDSSATKIKFRKNVTSALRYRPDILRWIIKLRNKIKRKNALISRLKAQVKQSKNKIIESSTQTDDLVYESDNKMDWTTKPNEDNSKDTQPSIADLVKEVASNALLQSGMVYVESAGLYYDYKSGYYYNPQLGLYYHSSTGCYYYYSEDKKEFLYHSHAEGMSVMPTSQTEKSTKQRRNKKEKEESTRKRKSNNDITKEKDTEKVEKKTKKQKESNITGVIESNKIDNEIKQNHEKKSANLIELKIETDLNVVKNDRGTEQVVGEDKVASSEELEEGECSVSEEEVNNEDSVESSDEQEVSDDFASYDHAPCIRIIVKETNLPKLKIGTLYIVTKVGGTLGREGEQHSVLLRDENISRIHLEFKYDENINSYRITDLGSRNGTILNGQRLSPSQVVSEDVEIVHGSILQVGETKLLCHIHRSTETCGHCEPGLIQTFEDKKARCAYRAVSVKKQHQLELARLKNKYVKQLPAIESGESTYVDRAKERRETVGSSHTSEKTKQADIHTAIEPENKGFKMLAKMGWKSGEGLGKASQGHIEPVPIVGNSATAGLGTGGVSEVVTQPVLTFKASRPALRKPAKLFDELEDSD